MAVAHSHDIMLSVEWGDGASSESRYSVPGGTDVCERAVERAVEASEASRKASGHPGVVGAELGGPVATRAHTPEYPHFFSIQQTRNTWLLYGRRFNLLAYNRAPEFSTPIWKPDPQPRQIRGASCLHRTRLAPFACPDAGA
jgi:hypothetical protein